MKHWLGYILLGYTLLMSAGVLADNPPSLTNFEQFYGSVAGLPAGTFTVKAQIGLQYFSTPIVNGAYGYRPSLTVTGNSGQQIIIYIDGQGITKEVTRINYVAGAIVSLPLTYPSATTPQNTAATSSNPSTTSNTPTSSSSSSTPSSSSSSTTTSQNSSTTATTTTSSSSVQQDNTCTYNWGCGSWSACTNNAQARTCRHLDTCDQQTKPIIKISKPDVQRACLGKSETEPASPAPKICLPFQKRCDGDVLETCSGSGNEWQITQVCQQGCSNNACKSAPAAAAPSSHLQKPAFPWAYLIGAIISLLVIVAITVGLIMRSQKYKPAQEYVLRQQRKGISNTAIKQRLESQGWSDNDIKKIMR